ncbi:MAG: alpha/beta hydrolase, partial [Verrucomicrobiae bacterium]|nr:alpha/beta hydrolase [Verrucomicrobiae bacterium]
FGQSDKPATGYDATTLVKDIVALLDVLRLDKVILAGHSVAGQEMTRMAADYPDRVSKLVYLDAAYDYSVGAEIILQFQALLPRPTAEDESSFASLLHWNRDHRPGWNSACENDFRATRLPDGDGGYSAKDSSPEAAVQEVVQTLILSGPPDFRKVNAPALGVFADNDVAGFIAKAEESQRDSTREIIENLMKWQRTQARLFGERVQGAQVIQLSGTDHFCFIQKQAEVVQSMRRFLKGN